MQEYNISMMTKKFHHYYLIRIQLKTLYFVISAHSHNDSGFSVLCNQLLIEFAGRLHISVFTSEDVTIYR